MLENQQDTNRDRLWKSPFVWVAIFGFIAIPLMRFYTRRIPPPPPVIGDLPTFQLTDHLGKPFALEQLKTQVTILLFFSSKCQKKSDPLLASMLKLQHSFKRYNISIRLLSITVDPDRDTPQHLRAYTDELKADLGTWSFVTGDLEQIQRLAGVLLPVAAKDKAERSHPVWKIAVTDKLWLIDQQGRIRGRPQQTGPPIPYYLTTAEGFDEIFHRAQHTLWQKYNTPKTRD